MKEPRIKRDLTTEEMRGLTPTQRVLRGLHIISSDPNAPQYWRDHLQYVDETKLYQGVLDQIYGSADFRLAHWFGEGTIEGSLIGEISVDKFYVASLGFLPCPELYPDDSRERLSQMWNEVLRLGNV